MRSSGKTTRAINQAIETLFDKGEVIIPQVSLKTVESHREYFKGYSVEAMEKVIFDPDQDINKFVQVELFLKTKKRLDIEHRGVGIETNKYKGRIKLK